jgi:hypothetical protein
MRNFFYRTSAYLVVAMFLGGKSLAQITPSVDLTGKDQPRPLSAAVPFLTISTDARSGAMGEVGAALSPDANATHWNVSRLAFIEKSFGGSLSYTPWLRKLINDMSLSYLTAYYKLSKEQAVAFSLTYFNLGEIQFTNGPNDPGQLVRPKEYAPMLSYSRKLSQNLSVGVSAKFIYSDLGGSLSTTSTQAKAGVAGAVDFGVYYTKDMLVGGKNSNLSLGAAITDIGSKISYTTSDQKYFIPTNLKVGAAYSVEVDEYNKFTFALDANKLMIPTPPVYDSSNRVIRGKDPRNIPLLQGIFGSFSDAPDGFKEELREITYSGGAEYWYNELFAARAGVFLENKLKGNRKYATFGFGLRIQQFGLDFAYLMPLGQRNSPLAETLRFTLHMNFEGKRQESVTE